MRVVLDTGAFYRPQRLRALQGRQTEVVVPAVAFAERVRQIGRAGGDVERFRLALARARFGVEPFGHAEALRMPRPDDARWSRHARDAMVAAHLRRGDVLWTTNPRDFVELGLRPEQVVAI